MNQFETTGYIKIQDLLEQEPRVFNPFVPTVAFNIYCPRDCVSRHNGAPRVLPLNPSETIVLWAHRQQLFLDNFLLFIGKTIRILLLLRCRIYIYILIIITIKIYIINKMPPQRYHRTTMIRAEKKTFFTFRHK